MILLLRDSLESHEREQLLARVRSLAEEAGASLRALGPRQPQALEALPATQADDEGLAERFRRLPGVEAVLTAARPLFRVTAEGRQPAEIRVKEARFGAGSVSVIAGPCAVEDETQLLTLALTLKDAGATALRGGAYKPRTSPYVFQGLGEPGLDMLQAAGRATGLAVVTEVMDTRLVGLVAARADVLQIGSRNMMNYELLREAGAAGRPVLLKRGMSATLSEFLHAAEYLAQAGCEEILLCERGLRHFDPAVRNLLDLSAVPALHERTHLPVLVDPSHGTGRARFVPAMLAAAAAAGADGFLVEVHPRPAESLSDPDQALSPREFADAIGAVEAVLAATGRRLARPGLVQPTCLTS